MGNLRLQLMNIVGQENKYVYDNCLDAIQMDIDLQNNPAYTDTIISTIIMGIQQLEGLMIELFAKHNQKFPTKRWNELCQSVLAKPLGLSKDTLDILQVLQNLRNWTIHEITMEKQEYYKQNSPDKIVGSGKVDMSAWDDYYHTKLSLTKNLTFEAITALTTALA